MSVPPRVSGRDPDEVVLSFFGSAGIESAMAATGFDVQEEMEVLIRHFRDPDPKVSLRAHGRLRSVIKEVASASGLLARQEVSGTDPRTGATYKVSSTASRIASRMRNLDVSIPTTGAGRPDFAAKYLPAVRDAPGDADEQARPEDRA